MLNPEELAIVLHPHPALRFEAVEITRIDDTLKRTVERMFELMYAARGIGLAANQVALPWRLFVLNLSGDPAEKDQEHVFVNPRIVKRGGTIEGEEGCLSLPDLYGPVKRSAKIVIEAFDLSGRSFRMELTELASRAVQHELDHLSGVLFIDHLVPEERFIAQPMIDDFEGQFRHGQSAGRIPADNVLTERLRQLAASQQAR